jgi:restriction system protein
MPSVRTPPLFARFLWPIVDTLRKLGGSARAHEVTALVVAESGVPSNELEQFTAAGLPRIKNQIHWARYYLVRAGYLDASERGVWRLTETGRTAPLDAATIPSVLKQVRDLPPTQPGVVRRRSKASVTIGEPKGIKRSASRTTEPHRRAS